MNYIRLHKLFIDITLGVLCDLTGHNAGEIDEESAGRRSTRSRSCVCTEEHQARESSGSVGIRQEDRGLLGSVQEDVR